MQKSDLDSFTTPARTKKHYSTTLKLALRKITGITW